MSESECPLCRLCQGEVITKFYYEDEVCIVVDCKVHKVPIIVLKRHSPQPTPEEDKHMRDVAERLFPRKKFRYGGRSIKDHYHMHET